MHGEEYDLHFAVLLSNLSRGIEAVQQGHGNIQDHHVRFESSGAINGGSSV